MTLQETLTVVYTVIGTLTQRLMEQVPTYEAHVGLVCDKIWVVRDIFYLDREGFLYYSNDRNRYRKVDLAEIKDFEMLENLAKQLKEIYTARQQMLESAAAQHKQMAERFQAYLNA